MANLPDRKDDQPRVDHGGQSGHFYLAESGHFYLAVTLALRSLDRYGSVLRQPPFGLDRGSFGKLCCAQHPG
jgi:hypothetical protein